MRVSGTLCSVLLCAALAACAPRGDVRGKATLFDRLGGKNALEAVVTQLMVNVQQDSRISGRFAQTNIEERSAKLVEQLCQATGGPCQYKGKDMKTAHLGMGLTSGDFAALMEDLDKALDKFNVAEPVKKELLGLLTPMSQQVVENP